MADFTIPVAFHFRLSIDGAEGGAFQEVTGLEREMPFNAIREGGDNRFVHRLPVGTKHDNLILKRGLVAADSALVQWCGDTLERGFEKPVPPRDLTVALVDSDGKDVAAWEVAQAWPIRWSVVGRDAIRNEIALETVELACASLHRRI